MESASASRKRLAGESFKRLLAALDPKLDLAGELYEKTRLRLVTFFRCNGCRECDFLDLVDETFRRVERRLDEGVEVDNVVSYIQGVARKVASEAHRRDKETSPLGGISESVSKKPSFEPVCAFGSPSALSAPVGVSLGESSLLG